MKLRGLCCLFMSIAVAIFPGISVAADTLLSSKTIREIPSPWNGNKKPSESVGEFYVSLFNDPKWIPDSASDCVDTSALAWLRKLANKESAQVSIMAVIKSNDGDQTREQRVPLFLMGIDEAASTDNAKCFSTTIKGQLSPWYRVDSNTKFDIQFEVGTNDTSDFSGAKNIFSAVDGLLRFSGSNNFIVKKLASQQIQDAGSAIDKTITDHLLRNSLDKVTYQFSPLASGLSIDGLEFSVPGIAATAGGVKTTATKTPAFTIGMVYVSSVFAGPDGKYPADYTQVLTRALAPQYGYAPPSLKALVEEGIGGVSRSNLEQLSTKENIEKMCGELRLQLSKGFATTDALVSRFAILRQFAPQALKTANLLSDDCLNDREKSSLTTIGYQLPAITRTGPESRDAEVAKRMDPIVKALRKGSAESLKELFVADRTKASLVVFPRVTGLPPFSASDASWNADGDQAVTKMAQYGRHARIGCYKAPPQGPLNQISAVSTFGELTLGALFHFSDDGRLEQLVLASVDDVRRLGGFGNDFPNSNCPLL